MSIHSIKLVFIKSTMKFILIVNLFSIIDANIFLTSMINVKELDFVENQNDYNLLLA